MTDARRPSVAELGPASGAAHSPLASIVIVTYGNRAVGPEAVAPRILELLAAQVRNSWVTVADLDVRGEADRVHATSGESHRRRLGVGRSGATPPVGGCTPEAPVGPVFVEPEGVGC